MPELGSSLKWWEESKCLELQGEKMLDTLA